MKEALHPVEKITSVYLIRHGHTPSTEDGLLYSDAEAELTSEGIKQAKAIAAWIKGQQIDVLLAGTAKRVSATAKFIADSIGKETDVVKGLDEWQVGDWENKSYWDIKKENPELYKKWSVDPIANVPPGGESIVQLYERVNGRFGEVVAQYEGKTIAFVSHAGIIRSVLVHALGMNIQNFWRLNVPVGSVSRVDFSKNFATVQFVALRPSEING